MTYDAHALAPNKYVVFCMGHAVHQRVMSIDQRAQKVRTDAHQLLF